MREHSMLVDERFDKQPTGIRRCAKSIIVAVTIVVLVIVVVVIVTLMEYNKGGDDLPSHPFDRAVKLMELTPLLDSHNDLPWQYRQRVGNNIPALPIENNLTDIGMQTDIPRIKQGRLGAQIWSVYVACSESDPVQATMEQIDVVVRMTQAYPKEFKLVVNSADIIPTFKSGLFPSLMGMEGGHSINSSMGALRAFYSLGARYLTLTHTCSTPWAQSANDNSGDVIGLTEYGKAIVLEMNRIGMMVDISHVAIQTMLDTLNVTKAPIIFSHSNARTLCDHIRNVPDEVLDELPKNGGVVMVVFYPLFACQRFVDESNRLTNTPGCDSACVSQGLQAYQKTDLACNTSDIVAHIDYIAKRIGVDHVGIGSDYDGVSILPVGLEDVSKYPNLIAELIEKGYSDTDINKILSGNIIRVLKQVETVAQNLQKITPVGPAGPQNPW